MAVSSVGIGSGLDVEKIVSQMVELEKSPLKNLQTKATTITTQISTYSEIKSLTATLNDVVSKMTRDSAWNGVSISASSSAITGTMTGIAATGTFNIQVDHLAMAQTSLIAGMGGAALAKDQAMGADGGMQIKVGDKTFDIEMGSTDTLTVIAAKVNDAGAGIQATVITDVDGSERLMLRSKDTGTSNAFEVTTSFASLEASTPQDAENALVKLNGVTVESASNTFASTIQGMSFTVTEKTPQPALLTVKSDSESMKKNIQAFVDAYNALNELLSKSTKGAMGLDGKVDETAAANGAGVLQGDSSAVSLQNALRMLTSGFSGSKAAFTRLSDIGIQMLEGGKLSVDETKLTKGLANVEALKGLFASKADASGNGGGIAVNFKSFTDKLLSFDGSLNSKSDSLEKSFKNNSVEQNRVTARADNLQARLYKQYSALDVKMSSLGALNSYVSQMVTTWNKSRD